MRRAKWRSDTLQSGSGMPSKQVADPLAPHLDVRLGAEVVQLVRAHFRDDLEAIGGVGQVTIVQEEFARVHMRILCWIVHVGGCGWLNLPNGGANSVPQDAHAGVPHAADDEDVRMRQWPCPPGRDPQCGQC